VNVHHKRMLMLLAVVAVLVVALGALYGYVDKQLNAWDGMYFAVVTVTTVGYGDIIPRGWADHLVALAIMILIIPAWTGVFSLLTTGMLASHVDKRHDDLKKHVTESSRRDSQ
jgi:voltage-gated potassium channel